MKHPLPNRTKVKHWSRKQPCSRSVVLESVILQSAGISGQVFYQMESGKTYSEQLIIKVINDTN